MKSAVQLCWRGGVLFLVGTLFTCLLNFQNYHFLLGNAKNRKGTIVFARWWLPFVFGMGSALIGLIYPHLEQKTKEESVRSQEWAHVLRCIAMYVGINEACIKVDFPSNWQLSISLAVLSVGLWWYFNRTTIGLGMGIITAAVATFVTQLLVYNQVYVCTEKEFLYVRSWLPCVVFSGGITVANIGKQLAMNDFIEGDNKSHAE